MSDSHVPGPEEPRSPLEPGIAGEAPAEVRPKRNTRTIAIVGAAAGVLVLGGAGAFAYTTLSGGGAQPHDVLPASALAYGRIDLDPSAGQKIEILRLLQKFPDLQDKIGDENADLRELFIEEAFGEDCDVDFAADVEPWLGQRVGGALLSEPSKPVLAVQVDDEDKARAGIEQLTECADEEAGGVAFLDGYAIVAEDQKTADAAVEAAAEKSLAEKPEFSEAIAKLGDQGVASGWADYGEFFSHPELLDEIAAEGTDLSGQFQTELLDELKAIGAATFVLRAESSAIEVRGASEGGGEAFGDPIDMSQVPDTTVMAIGQSFDPEFRDRYLAVLDELMASSGLDEQSAAEFESVTGVAMDEVMRFLLSDPLITVGERGLADIRSITGPEEVAGVDVALRTRGDQAELRGVAEGLTGAVSMMAGAELVVDDVEGGVAVATAKSALEAGSPLTSSETYRTVVPFDAPASIAYVDLDKIHSVVEEFAAGEESVVKNLAPLRAFAVSNAGNEFSMRLSFDG